MPQSNFQIILLVIFGFFAVIAVFIFSGFLPFGRGGGVSGEVIVWGTVKENVLAGLLYDLGNKNRDLKITYVEKNPGTFDREFVEALASARGPDLFFLPQDLIIKYEDKIIPISYETISERDFKNTYISEGELYLSPRGILGLPISVDPMVMYWNRDIFASAGVANPPSSWDEFLTLAPKLTKKDSALNIVQSALPFGEFKNVLYAKDILATLMMQLGNNLVRRDETGKPKEVFLEARDPAVRPAEVAFRFFTEFSDPAKPTYSWNRSLPNSKQSFTSERAAVYFGYASEILEIRAKNPHLDFDVVGIPQPGGSKIKVNFGRIQALAITRASKNPAAALYLAISMADKDFAGTLAENLYLPPARRDLLSSKPSDPYLQIFYDAALTARGWLDPTPEATDQIFDEAINNIVSGRFRVSEAVGVVRDELGRILQ